MFALLLLCVYPYIIIALSVYFFRQVVGELEQVLPADPSALASMDESHALQALPITISYMHDYFVHVAAQMEQLHNMVSLLFTCRMNCKTYPSRMQIIGRTATSHTHAHK